MRNVPGLNIEMEQRKSGKKNSDFLTVSSSQIVNFVQKCFYCDLYQLRVSDLRLPRFYFLLTVTYVMNVLKNYCNCQAVQ